MLAGLTMGRIFHRAPSAPLRGKFGACYGACHLCHRTRQITMMRNARGFFLAFYFKPFYLSEWFDE